MDAKNIYIAGVAYLQHVLWEAKDGERWGYVGVGEELNIDKVIDIIYSTFGGAPIYLVSGRQNSKSIIAEEAIAEVKEGLGTAGFHLWDTSFERVVEFNKIGVVRKGFREDD